jgi:uncharacterized damage-inducible protein DinB
MNRSCLNDLFRHMEWADALVWRAVFDSHTAVEDKRLLALFHHLHLVQHAHLRAWQGKPMAAQFPQFEESRPLLAWGRSCYDPISDHLKQLSDLELSNLFELPWTEIVTEQIGRRPAPVTLGEMMMQVPLHSLYHRGQINMRLREIGGQPPTVDYIVWRWLDKPLANWESVEDDSK